MDDNNTQYDSTDTNNEGVSPSILYPIIISVFSVFCLMSIAVFILTSRRCCKKKSKEDAESAVLKQRLAVDQKKLAKYKFKFPSAEYPGSIDQPILQQENNEIAEEVKETYKTIADASHTAYSLDEKRAFMPQYYATAATESSKVVSEINIDSNNDIIRKDNLAESVKTTEEINSQCDIVDKVKTQDLVVENMFKENEVDDVSDFKGLFFDRWIERSNDQRNDTEASVIRSENNLSYGEVDSILTSVSRMDPQRYQKLKDTKFYQKILVPTEEYCESNISDDSIETETLDEFAASKITDGSANLSHEDIMRIVMDDKMATKNLPIGNENENENLDDDDERKLETRKTILENNKDERVGEENQLTIQRSSDDILKNPSTKMNILRFIDKNSEMLFRVVKPRNIEQLDESKLTASEVYKNNRENPNFNDDKSDINRSSFSETKSYSTTTSSYFPRPKSLELRRKNTDLSLSDDSMDFKLDSINNNRTINTNSSNKLEKNKNDDESYSSSCSSKSSTTSWKELSQQKQNDSTSEATSTEFTNTTSATLKTQDFRNKQLGNRYERNIKKEKFSYIPIKNDKYEHYQLNESTLTELKDSVSSASSSSKKQSKVGYSKSFKRPRPPRSDRYIR